jgi:hypothetical protein
MTDRARELTPEELADAMEDEGIGTEEWALVVAHLRRLAALEAQNARLRKALRRLSKGAATVADRVRAREALEGES